MFQIWDVERGGKPVNTFSGKNEVRGTSFSPDGTFVAAGMDTGAVELYDVTTGQKIMTVI
jgi:WD40 repeat protein